MTADYIARISAIADEMKSAMRFRMVQYGDDRPLYVYVSPVDGGHAIGHDGQHDGMWRIASPVTCSTPYDRVWQHLANQLSTAPLYAGR